MSSVDCGSSASQIWFSTFYSILTVASLTLSCLDSFSASNLSDRLASYPTNRCAAWCRGCFASSVTLLRLLCVFHCAAATLFGFLFISFPCDEDPENLLNSVFISVIMFLLSVTLRLAFSVIIYLWTKLTMALLHTGAWLNVATVVVLIVFNILSDITFGIEVFDINLSSDGYQLTNLLLEISDIGIASVFLIYSIIVLIPICQHMQVMRRISKSGSVFYRLLILQVCMSTSLITHAVYFFVEIDITTVFWTLPVVDGLPFLLIILLFRQRHEKESAILSSQKKFSSRHSRRKDELHSLQENDVLDVSDRPSLVMSVKYPNPATSSFSSSSISGVSFDGSLYGITPGSSGFGSIGSGVSQQSGFGFGYGTRGSPRYAYPQNRYGLLSANAQSTDEQPEDDFAPLSHHPRFLPDI